METLTRESKFDGGLLGLIGINILASLITVASIGIAYPWAVCLKEEWIASQAKQSAVKLRFSS